MMPFKPSRKRLLSAALGFTALALALLAVAPRNFHRTRAADVAAGGSAPETGPNPAESSSGPSPDGSQVTSQTSRYTKSLVGRLAGPDFSQGAITEEQAAEWKQTLQDLTDQGTNSVAAIREFLAQNIDLDFTSNASVNLLGQSSLRLALINALSQIGGPEATAALFETLNTSALPAEIQNLAQALEQLAPGQYRQQSLKAAVDVLNLATSGRLPGDLDVGPLFKLLQTYGDSGTASALEQFAAPYKYYAMLALAALPDGQGLPRLVRQTQNMDDPIKQEFAIQMLAQIAAQYPAAAVTLLQQAGANQISDSTWRKVAIALAGDQYQIGQPPADSFDAGGNPPAGLKTFHIDTNNQNFFSVPLDPDDHIRERLALIDQLLHATGSNALAQELLQGAQANLATVATN